jgi:hypothetical protein
MYRPQFRQLFFDQFILPFDGQLDPQNRWIKLAEVVPWFEAEQLYAKNFTREGDVDDKLHMMLSPAYIEHKIR